MPQPAMRRLLIADDRARTRRALRAVLASRAGFELIGEAADGEEAIATVARLRPDIVIIDVRMPRLDGIAATRQIKARWPWIRVVAHSLAEELRADALAAGADVFVPKGASAGALFEALGEQADCTPSAWPSLWPRPWSSGCASGAMAGATGLRWPSPCSSPGRRSWVCLRWVRPPRCPGCSARLDPRSLRSAHYDPGNLRGDGDPDGHGTAGWPCGHHQ
jgi:CheY-like chemotaxis protein